MITNLAVKNFKCLLDVSVDLAPFTVLIGPNDSGKSSVLDAIQMALRVARDGKDAFGSKLEELVWRRDAARQIECNLRGTSSENDGFEYTVGALPLQYPRWQRFETSFGLRIDDKDGGPLSMSYPLKKVTLSSGQASVHQLLQSLPGATSRLEGDLRISSLRANALVSAVRLPEKYRLEPAELRKHSVVSSNPILSSTGDNLAAVLDGLLSGPDRNAVVALERSLSEAVPTLSGIALRGVPGVVGAKTLNFVLSGDGQRVTIPAEHASEGALLLTACLALVYGDTSDTLLIEEPENGLHPSRLKMVIDLFREIAAGSVGNRPRQVIITTHSPILLNYVRLDEVRIVRRDPESGTEITPMSAVPNVGRLLEEFEVGELWYLVGEDGLLRGNAAVKVLFVGEGPHDIGRREWPNDKNGEDGVVQVLARKACPAIDKDSRACFWKDLARFNKDARKHGYAAKVAAAVVVSELRFGCEATVLVTDRDGAPDRAEALEAAARVAARRNARHAVICGLAVESIEAWTLGAPEAIADELGIPVKIVRKEYPSTHVETLSARSGRPEHRSKDLLERLAALARRNDGAAFRRAVAERTNIEALAANCPSGFAPFKTALERQIGSGGVAARPEP